jgi:hypothetical protein
MRVLGCQNREKNQDFSSEKQSASQVAVIFGSWR